MSHFTVLVVTPKQPTYDDLHAALLPFHEYECTGYEEYVSFVPTNMEQANTEYARSGNDDPFDVFMRDYHGAEQEEGIWGKRTNPNKKWDWWQVGGRWANIFIDWDGRSGDSFQKRTLDPDAMANARRERRIKTWQQAEADMARGMNRQSLDFIYGIAPDMDKDTYLATDPGFTTFAILNEGIWHEKGQMGWFAMVSNEDKLWKNKYADIFGVIPDDHWITIVDCHI